MSASVRNVEVVHFVAAVRRELDDLAPDEIDELTGGLEADLDDALADAPITGFGSPADYAAELRSAAGLPPRAGRGGRRGAVTLGARVDAVQQRWSRELGRQPWWPTVREFCVALRPGWWVARAWIALEVILAVRSPRTWLPQSAVWWLMLGLLVIVSVELGRRGIAERRAWLRWLILAGNLAAAVLLVPFVTGAGAVQYVSYTDVQPPSNGLWLDGVEVRNVFPYDAAGRPLSDVQLFDERGRGLAVGESARTPLLDRAGGYSGQVPAVDPNNRRVWNVFPLRQQELQVEGPVDANSNGQIPSGPPTPAPLPLPTTAPVSPPQGASTRTPSAATPTPSAPTPSASTPSAPTPTAS